MKCKIHRSYKGIRKPTAKCAKCKKIYKLKTSNARQFMAYILSEIGGQNEVLSSH